MFSSFTWKAAPKFIIVVAGVLSWLGAGGAASADSFFDIFVDLMERGQIAFESTGPTQYEGIPTEIVSMSLTSSANPRVIVRPWDPGAADFQVDSFFDIEYRIDPTGQGNPSEFVVDSFFDIWTELSFTPGPSDPQSRTWDTEILSMDLAGASGPSSPFSLGLAPGADHHGHVTVLKLADPGSPGGYGYQVDSFFDIWTELSIDGGPPVPSAGATQLEYGTYVQGSAGIVPEPTTFLIWSLPAGLGVGLGWRRRR